MKFKRNMPGYCFECFRCGTPLEEHGEILTHPEQHGFKAMLCPFVGHSVANPDVFDLCSKPVEPPTST